MGNYALKIQEIKGLKMDSQKLQEVLDFLNSHGVNKYDSLLNAIISDFQRLENAKHNELKSYIGQFIRTSWGVCKIIDTEKRDKQIIVTFINHDSKREWIKVFNHEGHLRGYMKCFRF